MDTNQAIAAWKSILRNHPFFSEGGTFGFDWNTFYAVDPHACIVLRTVVLIARG